MKHYLCLSREHFADKYLQRAFNPEELARGWHGWRACFRPELLAFPPEGELHRYGGDDRLDPSHPRTRHWFDQVLAATADPGPGPGG